MVLYGIDAAATVTATLGTSNVLLVFELDPPFSHALLQGRVGLGGEEGRGEVKVISKGEPLLYYCGIMSKCAVCTQSSRTCSIV